MPADAMRRSKDAKASSSSNTSSWVVQGPKPKRRVVDRRGVGEAEGCRHFFTNGGLGSLGGALPAILWPDTCLDCPLAVEAFSFLAFPGIRALSQKETPGSLRSLGFGGVVPQLGF